ncbi:MAG: hypothetical protein J2P47_14610 [Acetobacteraceae bacterium]|nr:hypothetical protein [Acetobacteraceae bacterium]
MSDSVSHRLDDLGDALTACMQVMQDIRRALHYQTEVLHRILDAVTKESDGSLGELLEALISADHEHGRKLDQLLALMKQPTP